MWPRLAVGVSESDRVRLYRARQLSPASAPVGLGLSPGTKGRREGGSLQVFKL